MKNLLAISLVIACCGLCCGQDISASMFSTAPAVHAEFFVATQVRPDGSYPIQRSYPDDFSASPSPAQSPAQVHEHHLPPQKPQPTQAPVQYAHKHQQAEFTCDEAPRRGIFRGRGSGSVFRGFFSRGAERRAARRSGGRGLFGLGSC